MNLRHNISSLLLLALVLSTAACSKPSADENPNPKPGTGGSDPVPVDTEITSIHDLNATQGYLNSHAPEWQSSSLEMDFRSFMKLEKPLLSAVNARYPRIKKLKDNTFLLIYQQGPSAHDVYYARSRNFITWQNADEQLFAKTDMKQYESDVDDRVLFTSADAIVLDNGDILAFASFRLNKGYRLNPLNNGIMMRRSSDNGKTWSETQIIYRGTTWEPSALQLSTGEVHVYFTDANTTTGNSGTSLLRSTDRGATWTTVGKVIRQKAGTATDGSGTVIFTDQMPVAIQLNGSERIAVAFESRFGRTGTSEDKYHLGLAYSNDNWAAGPPAGDEDGPAERQNNLFLNQAAPYLRQFRSGETILSCNISSLFNMRIGDTKAWTFGEPMQGFPGKGSWGSIEIIDDHTLAGVFPEAFTQTIDGQETASARIQLAKFVLNHRINATQFTPALVGSSAHWKDVQDALFIGSVSQAQAVFRFAYDDDNLYCLVERLDNGLAAADGIDLMFQSGNATGDPLILKITPDAAKGTLACDNTAVTCAATVLGTFDETDNDRGYVVELAIPRERINVAADRILFNAVLHDAAGDDTFTGLAAGNYDKWLPVELKLPAEPVTEPEPGADDDNGRGPGWSNGEEVNPWK